MVKKIKEEKNIEYVKIDGQTFKEIDNFIYEYEWKKEELEKRISELDDIISNMKNPNDEELKEYGRNNHPCLIYKKQLQDEKKRLEDIYKSLFNNKNK